MPYNVFIMLRKILLCLEDCRFLQKNLKLKIDMIIIPQSTIQIQNQKLSNLANSVECYSLDIKLHKMFNYNKLVQLE